MRAILSKNNERTDKKASECRFVKHVLLAGLDYPCVGLLVPVRVAAFALVWFVLLAYTPVPLFIVCLLTLNQEVIPQAGDAGAPLVFVFSMFFSLPFYFASEGSGGLQKSDSFVFLYLSLCRPSGSILFQYTFSRHVSL